MANYVPVSNSTRSARSVSSWAHTTEQSPQHALAPSAASFSKWNSSIGTEPRTDHGFESPENAEDPGTQLRPPERRSLRDETWFRTMNRYERAAVDHVAR